MYHRAVDSHFETVRELEGGWPTYCKGLPKELGVASYTKKAKTTWTVIESVREFVQNLFDHVSSTLDIRATTTFSVKSQNEWELRLFDPTSGLEVASVVSEVTHQLRQMIRVSQVSGVITDDCFKIYTNKSKQKNAIGGFGEGFKFAIHSLMKLFSATVTLVNGNTFSNFMYNSDVAKTLVRQRRTFLAKNWPSKKDGVEFSITLKLEDAISSELFQKTVLVSQPVSAFLQMGEFVVAKEIQTESPTGVYVGGIFIKDVIGSLKGFTVNITPCAVVIQRDRNDLRLYEYEDHSVEKAQRVQVDLETFLVRQVCTSDASKKPEFWEHPVVKALWSSCSHAASLIDLLRRQHNIGAEEPVYLVSETALAAIQRMLKRLGDSRKTWRLFETNARVLPHLATL